MIHRCWLAVGARSALIQGEAMNSTDRSIEASSAGRTKTAMPSQSRVDARGGAEIMFIPAEYTRLIHPYNTRV
ncbi:hypothetical protein GCM10027067_07420 [Pseudactinotalea suaedae]